MLGKLHGDSRHTFYTHDYSLVSWLPFSLTIIPVSCSNFKGDASFAEINWFWCQPLFRLNIQYDNFQDSIWEKYKAYLYNEQIKNNRILKEKGGKYFSVRLHFFLTQTFHEPSGNIWKIPFHTCTDAINDSSFITFLSDRYHFIQIQCC